MWNYVIKVLDVCCVFVFIFYETISSFTQIKFLKNSGSKKVLSLIVFATEFVFVKISSRYFIVGTQIRSQTKPQNNKFVFNKVMKFN